MARPFGGRAVAKNRKLLQTEVTGEILGRLPTGGLTGRAAGPRPPRELRGDAQKDPARAGVRFMNATDPDDNVMEYHPSKREIAASRGKRKRKMRRR